MYRIRFIRAAAFSAIALVLAACDASHEMNEPVAALVIQPVAPARADPDDALTDKVRKALGVDENPVYGVEVTVTDGTVQLLGTVDSNAQRKRFGTIAAGVVGVRALDNRLIVDPGA